MYYIGIDLGTSSVKMLLVNEKAEIIKTVTKEYPLYVDGVCSEQKPDDWWEKTVEGLSELTYDIDRNLIRAVGTGGQMHGLVMLGHDGNVIRNAILWNDGRSKKQTDYLNCTVGKDRLQQYTGNIAFAGFTAPKLLWVKENEKENFDKISMILLPKDYLTYKLTGEFATDVSDASGMLLFDCRNRRYSTEMLNICGIDETKLPKVYESYEKVGTIQESVAKELGFPSDVAVAAGAGDNAAAAIGMGVLKDGECNISLGTSGTIFVSSDKFVKDSTKALHSFCHANGKWHLMGCMLSAASANKWFCEKILGSSDYSSLQSGITTLGENNVYFMPYLMGERCPHNDPDATGAFIGLKLDTSKEDMLLAVLEGVAFGIRDSLELIKNCNVDVESAYLCGGGAKSPLWQKIMANVLGIDIIIPEAEEGPSLGGAFLAMRAADDIAGISQCTDFVKIKKVVKCERELVSKYNVKYEKYKMLYPALKNIYDRG